jgi:hypothetical protein
MCFLFLDALKSTNKEYCMGGVGESSYQKDKRMPEYSTQCIIWIYFAEN